MPPKRKVATRSEAPAKVAKTAAKPATAKPPAKAAAKAPPAKPPAKGKKAVDPMEFAEALMDCCKCLMGVCDTKMDEDEEAFAVSKTHDFARHGSGVLKLLPEDARVPMMNMAYMYMEELDADNFMWGGDEDDDDDDDDDDDIEDEEVQEDTEAALADEAIKFAEDADDADDDEDDDDDGDDDGDLDLPDMMKASHFFPFKGFFSQVAAAALIKSTAEGGALYKAMDAAYDSWREAMEAESAEDDEGDDEEVEGVGGDDDDEDDDSDDDFTPDDFAWKGED